MRESGQPIVLKVYSLRLVDEKEGHVPSFFIP